MKSNSADSCFEGVGNQRVRRLQALLPFSTLTHTHKLSLFFSLSYAHTLPLSLPPPPPPPFASAVQQTHPHGWPSLSLSRHTSEGELPRPHSTKRENIGARQKHGLDSNNHQGQRGGGRGGQCGCWLMAAPGGKRCDLRGSEMHDGPNRALSNRSMVTLMGIRLKHQSETIKAVKAVRRISRALK